VCRPKGSNATSNSSKCSLSCRKAANPVDHPLVSNSFGNDFAIFFPSSV
jgi:hypothetical protein